MHSANYLLLFGGAAVAQSSVQVLAITYFTLGKENYYPGLRNETVSQQGSNPTATTYVNTCSQSIPFACLSLLKATSTVPLVSVLESVYNAEPTGNPCSDVPNDVLINPDIDVCIDYTLIQGPSTYSYHETMHEKDLYTLDANCNWQGDMATADITCTQKGDGDAFKSAVANTTTLKHDEIASSSLIVPVTVVATASTTLGADSKTGVGNAKSSSSSPGLGPAGPLPTGFAGIVGGAAAVFAAAIAF